MNILEQTKNGVPVLYADGIEAAGGAVHGFSTRKGGVSQGIFASLNLGLTRGDDPEHVRENYRRFLSAAGSALTPLELKTLPDGARLMTLEVGLRFLADYLNGDVYFRTAYPEHNLVRARNQFKLVREMEEKRAGMDAVIEKYL